MPRFVSVCRCCNERLFAADIDPVWEHFTDHSEEGHDASFHRTARTDAPERTAAGFAVEPASD